MRNDRCRNDLTASQLPDNLNAIETGIELRIPLGAGAKNTKITSTARKRIEGLTVKAGGSTTALTPDGRSNLARSAAATISSKSAWTSRNTSGWCCTPVREVSATTSPSYHIKIAQKLMALRKIPLRTAISLISPKTRKSSQTYVRDLLWAQDFALANREEMMDRAMCELSCTHVRRTRATSKR